MNDIKLYCGDCLELMQQIPEHSVDMVLCDLPYGLTQNKWDSVIPFDKLWADYERVTKHTAVIALHASQPFTSALVMSNPKMFKHEWIWIKNRGSNFANTVREPMKEHESVLIFSKGKWTYNRQMQERTGGGLARVQYKLDNRSAKSSNYREFNRKNNNQGILRVPSSWQKFNVEVGLHPTQKPVPLLEYLIKTFICAFLVFQLFNFQIINAVQYQRVCCQEFPHFHKCSHNPYADIYCHITPKYSRKHRYTLLRKCVGHISSAAAFFCAHARAACFACEDVTGVAPAIIASAATNMHKMLFFMSISVCLQHGTVAEVYTSPSKSVHSIHDLEEE